jgi:hypothetical protein
MNDSARGMGDANQRQEEVSGNNKVLNVQLRIVRGLGLRPVPINIYYLMEAILPLVEHSYSNPLARA